MALFSRFFIVLTLLFTFNVQASDLINPVGSAEEIGTFECSMAKLLSYEYENVSFGEYKDRCLLNSKQGDIMLSLQEGIYYVMSVFALAFFIFRGYKHYEHKQTNKKSAVFRVAVLGGLSIGALTPVSVTSNVSGKEYHISGAAYMMTEFIIEGTRNADRMVTTDEREYFDQIILKGDPDFRQESYRKTIVELSNMLSKNIEVSEGATINVFEDTLSYSAKIQVGRDLVGITQQKDISARVAGSDIGIDFVDLETKTLTNYLPSIINRSMNIAHYMATNYKKETNELEILNDLHLSHQASSFVQYCPSLTDPNVFPLNVDARSLGKYVALASYCLSREDHSNLFSNKQLLVNDSTGLSEVSYSEMVSSAKSICSSGAYYECAALVKYLSRIKNDKEKDLGAFNLIYDAFRVLPLKEKIKVNLSSHFSLNTGVAENGASNAISSIVSDVALVPWEMAENATEGTDLVNEQIPKTDKELVYGIPLTLPATKIPYNSDFKFVYLKLTAVNTLLESDLWEMKSENIQADILKGMTKFIERLNTCVRYPNTIVVIQGDLVPCQHPISEISFFGSALGDFGMYLRIGALTSSTKNVKKGKDVGLLRESIGMAGSLIGPSIKNLFKLGLGMVGLFEIGDVDPFGAGDNSYEYGVTTAVAVSFLAQEPSLYILIDNLASLMFVVNMFTTIMMLYVPFSMLMSLVKLVTMILTKAISLVVIIKKESNDSIIKLKNSILEMVILVSFMPMIIIFLYYVIIQLRGDLVLFFMEVYEPNIISMSDISMFVVYMAEFILFIMVTFLSTAAFVNLVKKNCFKIPSLIVDAKNSGGGGDSKENELTIHKQVSMKHIHAA